MTFLVIQQSAKVAECNRSESSIDTEDDFKYFFKAVGR